MGRSLCRRRGVVGWRRRPGGESGVRHPTLFHRLRGRTRPTQGRSPVAALRRRRGVRGRRRRPGRDHGNRGPDLVFGQGAEPPGVGHAAVPDLDRAVGGDDHAGVGVRPLVARRLHRNRAGDDEVAAAVLEKETQVKRAVCGPLASQTPNRSGGEVKLPSAPQTPMAGTLAGSAGKSTIQVPANGCAAMLAAGLAVSWAAAGREAARARPSPPAPRPASAVRRETARVVLDVFMGW